MRYHRAPSAGFVPGYRGMVRRGQSLDALIRSLAPAAWFRPGVGITVTGSGVSQWDDQSGNGRHLLQGTDAARPIDLPFSGTRYLYLPGAAGNYASTPDSVANSITGDIDIRVRVALDDWTPAATNVLVSKYVGVGNYGFILRVVAPSGLVQLFWTADGTNGLSRQSSLAPSVTNGEPLWIRATLDVNNGAGNAEIKFYTSSDGASWTQLGSTQLVGATTSIFDSTSALEVGSRGAGSLEPLAGKIYRAIIKDGIDGTTVVDFNPADADGDGDTSFASSTTGETWTINSSGGLPAYLVGAAGVMADGSADYLRATFTSDQPFTDYLVVRPLSWTSGDQLIGGVTANAGAIEQSGLTPAVVLYDGAAVASNTNLALNAQAVVCAVHNGASSSLRVNNTIATTGDAGAGNPGGITLFANNTPGGYANAIAREGIRFPGAHSAAQQSRIIAGLMARHGVA